MLGRKKLSKMAIGELHAILKKDYSMSISEEEVQKLGNSLLRLTEISVEESG